jgi:hypothetical protein
LPLLAGTEFNSTKKAGVESDDETNSVVIAAAAAVAAPSDHYIAQCIDGGIVELVSSTTRKVVHTLRVTDGARGSGASNVSIDPTNTRLVVHIKYGAKGLQIWDLSSQTLQNTVPVSPLGGDIAWSADGTHFIGLDFESQSFFVVNAVEGREVSRHVLDGINFHNPYDAPHRNYAFAYRSDHKMLLVMSDLLGQSGEVLVFDAETGASASLPR